MLVNLVQLIYIGRSKPLIGKTANRLEFLGENLICLLTILSVIFTDFCPDTVFRYNVGWIFVGLLIFGLGCFLVFVFMDIFRSVRMMIIKYYRKL